MPVHLIDTDNRLRTNYVVVKSLSDFPTPSGGIITLADFTTYELNGAIDIGSNRIVCGAKNIIRGLDRSNDSLTSSTTGALITCDSSSVVKTILTLDTMTVSAPSGSFLDFTSSSANQSIVIQKCTIGAFTTLGTINNCSAYVMRNSTILGAISSNGFTITGTSTSFFFVRDCSLRGCAGTMFNFGTAVYGQIQIDRNICTITSGQTMVNGTTGGANVTVAGTIAGNIFTGGGTYVNTITKSDTNWLFTDNIGIANTLFPTADLGTGTANSTTFLRGDQTWATPSGGGGATATTVETDLGSTAKCCGKFTITDAGISASSKVLCWQAPGPYTGKGTRADEAEMQPVQVIAVEPGSGSAVVKWQTPPMVIESPSWPRSSPNLGLGTAANSGTNRDIPVTAQRIGKVRGNVKFSYMVLA